ncbi:MAG TPA: helix-turn-helix domain-containing protein, partial [Myxococcales bacterium]|nr:helix-turn-helix domain-containing protein [Myxococcales bacterium]
PPLRDRREDLGLIVAALLRRHFAEREVELAADAARALLLYQWPLNVRELERCLQAAVVQAGDRPVELRDFPSAVAASLSERATPRPAKPLDLPEPDLRRRQEIIDALRKNDWNVTATARDLGKARVQLQRWIKRYRIDRSEFQR